jgi:hypothetical protein
VVYSQIICTRVGVTTTLAKVRGNVTNVPLYCCSDLWSPEAHWSPFQGAAATYIRSLPKPWTNTTEALVAFFFGVVRHQY